MALLFTPPPAPHADYSRGSCMFWPPHTTHNTGEGTLCIGITIPPMQITVEGPLWADTPYNTNGFSDLLACCQSHFSFTDDSCVIIVRDVNIISHITIHQWLLFEMLQLLITPPFIQWLSNMLDWQPSRISLLLEHEEHEESFIPRSTSREYSQSVI